MNSPLRGRVVIPADALRAAADGGVEISQAEQRDGPSLFVGIQLEVDEIIMGRNIINTKCTALREAMVARQEAGVKEAADEIAKIASQMFTLAAHLAGVIAKHQARRPRA